MKTLILFLVLILVGITATAQQVNPSDSTLKNIEKNVEKIKEEIVKESPAPYTGQSIFEDRKGGSAIFLPSGGTFRLNTADASIKLSFANKVSNQHLFYGFDISGKNNDGLLSIISQGDISPGVKINGIIGYQELFSGSDILDGWIALKIGYEGASFKLFYSDSSFSSQVKKTTFNAFITSLAFNLKIGGNKVLALSVGYQKANNYSDLDKIELTDKKTINDTTSNTIRVYENKFTVRSGDYKISNQIPINLDFFWTPNSAPRIGFYHYWRTMISDNKATNGFGTGLYLLKKNNPLSSIVGLVFEVNDISKLSDGFGNSFTINILVAYNFGFMNQNLH
jgi:hypothetical protein